jgi:hypothetical protein
VRGGRKGEMAMPVGTSLAKYDAACRALAAAKNTDEIKRIHNIADRMRLVARQAQNRELEVGAIEIRIRAERRLGKMIAEQKRTVGLAVGAAQKGVGRRGKRGSRANPHSAKISLAEAGVSKRLAHAARKLAAPSEKEFESLISNWRQRAEVAGNPITIGLLNVGRPSVAPPLVPEPENEKTLGEMYLEETDLAGALDVTRKFCGEAASILESKRFRLCREEDRQKLAELLKIDARAPAGAKVEKGFESIIGIIINTLWYLHMYHLCLKGNDRKFNIDSAFDAFESRVDSLLKAMAKTG